MKIIETGRAGLPSERGGRDNMENFEGIDLLGYTLPVYRIEYKRNPKTRNDPSIKEGWFTSSLGEQKETLRCVILRGRASRVYWPPYNPNEENPTPICKSNDAIRPSPDVENPLSKECAVCPYAQWQEGKKPECALVYNLLCLDLDTGIPFVISAKRTSLKPLRNYLTRFKFRMIPTYAVETIVKAKKIDTYYILDFTEGEALRKQDIETVAKYAEDLADVFRKTDVTEVAEEDEEAMKDETEEEDIKAEIEEEKEEKIEPQEKKFVQKDLFKEE